MALFRKLFYRKPPDGLLEISERVYVFDACFTTEAWEERDIKSYVRTVVGQLRDYYPDASILVFNFREGKSESEIGNALSEYDMTIMDYPRHYEGCPLLSMEVIHHFLRSSESWLSLGQQNVLLMHCERGGWPVLTFMLAAHLIYMKQYTGEQRTLDMIYRQAPRELLNLLSPLNPIPSQLRYLQYISRRNVASAWPPLDRALALDCVIMRLIPDFDGLGGLRPIFRIYGQNPFLSGDRTPKLLFSTPKRSKVIRHYKQEQCQLVKIDINCHVQGDVVLECISLHEDMEREEMIFRVMFNTAFIRSNILILNRDEIDILWDAKERFPREFRAEVLFSDMDAAASVVLSELSCFEEKDGLPIEAFAKVQEMFNSVDWIVNNTDIVQTDLDSLALSNLVQEKLNTYSHPNETSSSLAHESKTWLNLASASLSPKTPKTPPTPPPLPPEAAKLSKPSTNDSTGKLVLSPLSPSPSKHVEAVSHPLNKHAEAVSHPLDKHAETPTADSCPNSTILSSTLPDSVVGTSIASKPSSPQRKPSTLLTSSMDINQPVTAQSPKPATDAKTPTPLLPDSNALKFSATDLSHPVNGSSLEPSIGPSPKLTYSAIHPPPSLSPPPPIKPPSSLGTQPIIPSTPSLPSPPLPVLSSLKEGPPGVGSSPPPPPPTMVSSSKENQDVRTSSPLFPPWTDSSLKEYNEDKTPLPPVPPPPPPAPPMKDGSDMKQEPSSMLPSTPPPPPPPSLSSSKVNGAPSAPPPPPPMKGRSDIEQEPSSMFPRPSPPPLHLSSSKVTGAPSAPPPPPPPLSSSKVTGAPSAPPPPAPPSSTISPGGVGVPNVPFPAPPTPMAPFGSSSGAKLKSLTRTTSSKNTKKLKPLHWLKLTRAVQGSLWAETQKSGEFSKAPEIDITELETLFSAAVPTSDQNGLGRGSSRANLGNKPEKVQLVDHRRAYNCEIMLSKVKVPLQELMSSVLSLVDSALDVDQVDNLIKFCPTKEEMELLKGYTGDKENLGKCEQFFLELMQIPRIEAKLRIFSFKMQFQAQVSDLRKNLNIVNSVSEQARSSVKFKRVMQTILSLGNALNQGTARGSAIGFKLDSLPKLTDTRARNNKMTLMHYLCKVLIDKLPELLDFAKDLDSLESATKIQLKILAEEMQAISKGLEKVIHELSMSESDGPVSEQFREVLKEFLSFAEAEVRSLASLYSAVGRNVDSLILYFGEDPARCTFEQVVSTLLTFVRMFNNAHEENLKQVEAEKKKAEKALENEKPNNNNSRKEKVSANLLQSPVKKIK